MSQAAFSFDIKSTDYSCALGISVWYQNTCLFDLAHVAEPATFSYSFDDEVELTHEIKITISGKKPEHTKVDSQGNIISDVLLILDNFALDGICIDPLINSITEYHHDGNGSIDPVIDQFHKHAGCNGDLIFSFRTPMYLWLLERF